MVGGSGLYYHSNRSPCGITAVAQSVMALLAHRPAAPSPSSPPLIFFMSRPSLSAPVQRKLLHTVWILLHDDEQNTGGQSTGEAPWLVSGRRACEYVCTPRETSYIRGKGFPYYRRKKWRNCHMPLCFSFKTLSPTNLQCLFLESFVCEPRTHVHIQKWKAKFVCGNIWPLNQV